MSLEEIGCIKSGLPVISTDRLRFMELKVLSPDGDTRRCLIRAEDITFVQERASGGSLIKLAFSPFGEDTDCNNEPIGLVSLEPFDRLIDRIATLGGAVSQWIEDPKGAGLGRVK